MSALPKGFYNTMREFKFRIMTQKTENNFLQVGKMTTCGVCCAEEYAPCDYRADLCICICHKLELKKHEL